MTIDADDYQRFVIAKFFAPASKGIDKTRRRATRTQVRRFALAALRTAVKDHARDLPSRSLAAARKLAAGDARGTELLPPPQEEQRSLRW